MEIDMKIPVMKLNKSEKTVEQENNTDKKYLKDELLEDVSGGECPPINTIPSGNSTDPGTRKLF